MSFIVGFVTSEYTLSSYGTFYIFQNECFRLPLHSQVFTTKLKNIVIKAVLCKKTTAWFDRKEMELKCLIKEKDDGIALNKGPTISLTRKRGPKKQSPRVLQFIIKDTTA